MVVGLFVIFETVMLIGFHFRNDRDRATIVFGATVIANPKLILADEPTGNLHSSQGKEIMELFKKLNDEGTTIVQVTHSEANAAYGHRVVQLADGWIVSPKG